MAPWRIAERIIRAGRRDGSLERQGYVSPDYRPVNEPLVVKAPGAFLSDPNRWQPLALDIAISQNGQPLPDGTQVFVGPHWGYVDAWFDPECPKCIVDPALAHVFCPAAESILGWLGEQSETTGSSGRSM